MKEGAEPHFLPGELPEDEQQEKAIAQWQGKRPPSGKRALAGKEVGYGLTPTEQSVPVWSVVPRPDYAHIHRLTTWVFAQEDSLREEVLTFLDDPSEERLQDLMQKVGKTYVPTVREGSLTDLILRAVPATMDQLFTMARLEHPSKRPEAAVRQNVRNLIRAGRLVRQGDTVCLATGLVKRTRGS